MREVGGKQTADAHIASTAKVQKSVICQHLTGERKPHKPDWQPRYMTFPMKAYTKREGLLTVVSGERARKALKQG